MTEKIDTPLLVDTGKGVSVKWKGRFLYSSRDPVLGVSRRIKSLSLENNTLYLIPSPLLCYGIEELKKRIPNNSFILGLERFQELMATTLPLLPDNLTDKDSCQIIRSDSSDQILLFIDSLGAYRFRRCRMLILTGGYNLDSAFYDGIEKRINRHIFNQWQTKASLMKMGPLWFSNIFKNLEFFSTGIFLDQLKIKGSIILCGAGESLEQGIPLIKELRERVFLLAVDTAYPALLAHGIVPDGVFNLDGQFYNYYDFYKHRGNELFLFSDITAFPASLRLKGVKNVFFSSQFIPNTLLNRLADNKILPTPIPPLGSVGVTSLFLCRKISEGNLILAGLDFSYTPGKSHAKGTIYHDLYLMRTKKNLPDGGLTALSYTRPRHILKGRISGKKLRSDTVLEGYYRDFCDLLSQNSRNVFMVDGDYPSLGVPAVDKFIMDQLPKEKSVIEISPSLDLSLHLDNFNEIEITLLDRIISLWEDFSDHGDSQYLDKALEECDYLTIPLNHDKNDPVYYSQAVRRARYYRKFLP